MISVDAALRLERAGVRWRPAAGDRFTPRGAELRGEVFTLADMVVEARETPTGTVLAFNGTTEWALDSLRLDDALWLPREDQLRGLLGGAFRGLVRVAGGWWVVVVAIPGQGEREFRANDPEQAYADAVLALVEASAGEGSDLRTP